MGSFAYNLFFIFSLLLFIDQSCQRPTLDMLKNIKVEDSYGKFNGAGDLVGAIRDPSLTPMVDASRLIKLWKRIYNGNQLPPSAHIRRIFSRSGGTDGWYYGSNF